MSVDPELQKAYSPSEWCKRGNATEIIQQHIQEGEKITNKAQSSISCDLDVPYGVADRAKYDIYGTNLRNDDPIFIFIHGGYWQELSKESACFHVESFVSNGIKVYNVGYTLCPTVTLSEIISQIKCAVEKILKHALELGSKCVWIAGHSAGAHMAASLLHDPEWLNSMRSSGTLKLIKGIILIAGIYDLEPLIKTNYNDALRLTQQEIKNLSLRTLDTATYEPVRDVKVVVTVGECDAPKFVQESKLYAQKLIDFVDDVEFFLLRDNIDHFDIIENLVDTNFVLTKKILKFMKTL